MKQRRVRWVQPARRDVYERLSQQLETFLERERRAKEAMGISIEDHQLTQARLALFGSAPK